MSQSSEGSLPVIYIGLDLGTTHSSIAYQIVHAANAHQATAPSPNLTRSWLSSDHDGRVPTVLFLDKDKNASLDLNDSSAATRYRLQWFKLMMLHMDDLSDFRNSDRLKTAESNVECQLGGDSIDKHRIHLTVTTPVNWPSDAISRMKQAMRDAGIRHEPRVLAEPEAASLSVLPSVFTEVSAKDGDAFIICDCGGATVDCVGFQAYRSSTLSLSQCTPSEYIFAGATILDDVIFRLVLSKLHAQGVTSNFPNLPVQLRKSMRRWWELIVKIDFCDGYQPGPFRIENLSGSKPQILEIAISGQEVATVFDSVVGRISKLVNSQICSVKAATGQLPRALIIVGGFGRNSYLRSKVHASVEQEHGGAVKTISFGNDVGWTSVALGAVKHAIVTSQARNLPLDVIVDKRLLRARYGIRHANNDYSWFVEVGARISTRQPDLYEVHPQAFQPFNDTGMPYLALEIYTQLGANASVRRACLLRWFTELGTQFRGSLQLGLTHDGMEPCFTFYVEGQLQEPAKASFQYAA